MKIKSWKDLNHGFPPAEMARIKQEALDEYDRIGFAALRKARRKTQVELAKKLGISQGGVSAIENNSDLLLSTLAKYVRALGGDVQIHAVFPEATFNLESLPPIETSAAPRLKKRSATERKIYPAKTKAARMR